MRSALAVLLVAAAAAALAAQSTTPPSPPDGSTATATGCLAKGAEPGAFVLTNVRWDSANAPASKQGGHHEQQPPPSAPSVPPSMTTPTTPSTAPAESAAKKTADEALQRATTAPPRESLRLAGAATQSKLAEHVGHTITATGMVMAADPAVTPGVVLPEPPRGPAKPAPKSSGEPPMRVLNLRSFTDVSRECK
jgi:hypothetical protein